MARAWAVALLLAGCAPVEFDFFRPRAASDLRCDSRSVRYVEVDELRHERIARGCGREIRYQGTDCALGNHNCRWWPVSPVHEVATRAP